MALVYKGGNDKSNTPAVVSDNAILRKFDFNKDRTIGIDEVYQAIDSFFDGQIDVSPSQLSELIDYFFEQ